MGQVTAMGTLRVYPPPTLASYRRCLVSLTCPDVSRLAHIIVDGRPATFYLKAALVYVHKHEFNGTTQQDSRVLESNSEMLLKQVFPRVPPCTELCRAVPCRAVPCCAVLYVCPCV